MVCCRLQDSKQACIKCKVDTYMEIVHSFNKKKLKCVKIDAHVGYYDVRLVVAN